jgi:LIVCS family branched-chain amino acid:cation transporter
MYFGNHCLKRCNSIVQFKFPGLKKKTLIAGFALFSMLFGAGNLILPPYIGNNAGDSWGMVTLGFLLSAVAIPVLAVIAHAKLQGTMYDFGKKVSPLFSSVYCIIIYLIAITLPSPRTAAVTHEMAIQPFFESNSLLTSTVYFFLVMLFALNRSKVISILGRYLTPIIVLILAVIIFIAFNYDVTPVLERSMEAPFKSGMLEGYQTYDAVGGIVGGAILIISLRLIGENDYHENRKTIIGAAMISGIGLTVIYTGLIIAGAFTSGAFPMDVGRTALLSGLSKLTLGNAGNVFLSILVGLACFTTAVGITTGVSDYFKGIFNQSNKVYVLSVVISCVLGVVIGQFDVHYIIVVAIPVLMSIYPLTIIMILLNVFPDKWVSSGTFRWVAGITFLFSMPDFVSSLGMVESMEQIRQYLPFGEMSLGWLVPAVVTLIIGILITQPWRISSNE